MVEVLVDEVDRATGHLHPVLKRLRLGLESRKRWQQAGVDVQDTVRKRRDESRWKQTHIPCEADQIDPLGVQSVDKFEVALGGGAPGDGNVYGGQAEFAGSSKPWCVRLVREDDGDKCIGDLAGGDGAMDREEVGAAPREQNADAFHVGWFDSSTTHP